jgi:hypothetical protein
MKKILLKFLSLLFGLMASLHAETIEQIGPVTTIDTTDAPDLSKPIVVIGAVMRLDTRNPDLEFSLSGNTVQENQPVGTEVGRFRSSDSVTFSLISGAGSSGNPNFTLSTEGVLKTEKQLNYQDGSEYSIRVQATNDGVKLSKIFKITILPNSIVVPPPSTPSNPWQKRYEELLIVINDTEQKIKERNADLEEKEEKVISLEKEQAEIKEKIAELGLDVSSKKERIASLNEEVEQVRAKLELEELAQANLLSDISEKEGVIEKRKAKSEELSQQVEGLESTLASLNLKLKVPHVRGWHYATEKGWMWTDLDIYPLVFFIDKNKWFEYEQGSAHPWIYKDLKTNTSWQWSE